SRHSPRRLATSVLPPSEPWLPIICLLTAEVLQYLFTTMLPHQSRRDIARGPPPPLIQHISFTAFVSQCRYLDDLANAEIPAHRISDDDLERINQFRVRLRSMCRSVFFDAFPYLQGKGRIELQLIGSVASGLALKGSDMDMVLAATFPRPYPATEV